MHDAIKALEAMKQELAEQKAKSCQLIVVSKKKPAEVIYKLSQHGHKDFGENYVQEFLLKQDQLIEEKIRWHFIGQLQRNKVKQIVGKVYLIHSVDSLRLLEEVDKRARAQSLTQKILLQISFSKEEHRGGKGESDISELVSRAKELENIELCGLMTVPPIEEDAKEAFYYFKKLSDLLQQMTVKYSLDESVFCELSMGMTGDYKQALDAGSTMLRIGSKILGQR